jgi:uracil-DNA glycosylase
MSYIKIEIFDSNSNITKVMMLEPFNVKNKIEQNITEHTYNNAINFLTKEIDKNQHKPFLTLYK